MVHEWQEAVIAFRCQLDAAEVKRLGGPAQWDCADVKFAVAYLSVDDIDSPIRERIEAIPTRLALAADQIDAAIEGARRGTLGLPPLRIYINRRVGGSR
jgi:NTE family protein